MIFTFDLLSLSYYWWMIALIKNVFMLDGKAPCKLKQSLLLSRVLIARFLRVLEKQERNPRSSCVTLSATHAILSHARIAIWWALAVGSLHAGVAFLVARIARCRRSQATEIQLILQFCKSDPSQIDEFFCVWILKMVEARNESKKREKCFRYKMSGVEKFHFKLVFVVREHKKKVLKKQFSLILRLGGEQTSTTSNSMRLLKKQN